MYLLLSGVRKGGSGESVLCRKALQGCWEEVVRHLAAKQENIVIGVNTVMGGEVIDGEVIDYEAILRAGTACRSKKILAQVRKRGRELKAPQVSL